MAFEADRHAKSRAASAGRQSSGGAPSRRNGSLLFVSGFALGVVTTALVVLLLSPEMSTPEVEETAAVHDVHRPGAQGALEGSQPSAAAPVEPSQPLAAEQPTAAEPAAAQELPPGAALAASAPGTETTPSAATAAPEEPARPQVADAPVAAVAKPAGANDPLAAKPAAAPAAAKPTALAIAPPAAQARAAQPAAPTAKPAPSAPPPAKPEPPVDPNSQDAKLAAAAVVRQNAGTPIDSMLDQAFSPGAKGDKPAAAPTAATPPTPTRDDVIKAMSVLIPAIRGCAQGQSGMAPVSIVVQSDGRVESAALSSGPFQGTASGRCMEGVVRRARFPRFSQPSFRVQFPFAVQ